MSSLEGFLLFFRDILKMFLKNQEGYIGPCPLTIFFNTPVTAAYNRPKLYYFIL